MNGLASDRTLTDLALEAGHQVTRHQRLESITNAPHPLPWAAAPKTLHHSDTIPSELRDYLDHVANAITTRVDRLTDHAITERPTWTEAPTDETTFERWHTAIALAAAHRDQARIDTNNLAHPFGPYLDTVRAGHHAWWAAASAVLAIDNPDAPAVPTGLAATIEQQLAHTIARDLYALLPQGEREAAHAELSAHLGPTWELLAGQPGDAAVHPAIASDLLHVLFENGLVTSELAADLGITAPQLDNRGRIRGGESTVASIEAGELEAQSGIERPAVSPQIRST